MSQPITTATLLQMIQRLELADESRLADLARFASELPTLNAFLQYAFEHNDLTAFQMERLLNGEGDSLRLRQYVLLDQLGEGGMGQVYRAWHRLLNREVAIKIVRKELMIYSHIIERFLQEARLAANCSHLNLVAIHDADIVSGNHYLVMEYIAGTDLHRLIQRDGPISVPLACEYIQQAALGLQHAHSKGMVHRDVKPANILVAQGIVKVADLGLARLYGSVEQNDLTGPGVLLGSPDFLAPEQADNPKSATQLSDIYSLGYTLYFLLAGRLPYPGGSPYEKILRHRAEQPAPVSRFRDDVPPALELLINAMTAKSPANRPSNLAEIARQLLLHTPPHVGSVTTELRLKTTSPRLRNRTPIRSWLLGSGLTMLIIGIIAGAYLWPTSERIATTYIVPINDTASQPVGEALNADNFKVTQQWELNSTGEHVAFSPDGTMIACLSHSDTQNQFRLFIVGKKDAITKLDLPSRGRCLAFGQDGLTVVIGTEAVDGQAKLILWDVIRQKTRAIRILPTSITCVGYWTANSLLTATSDGVLQRWNINTNGPDLQAAWSAHDGTIQSMVYDHENDILITASIHTIKCWPNANISAMTCIDLPKLDIIQQLVISLDGEELLGIVKGGSGSALWTWNSHKDHEIVSFPADTNGEPIDACVFSLDHRMIAIAAQTNLGLTQVRFWDVHDCKWCGLLQSDKTVLNATAWTPIHAMNFSPDARHLVTCGNQVIVWKRK